MEQAAQNKIPLVVIIGPTASGKSRLAVELAHFLQTEIISADSMQIYQGMAIGTAKPTKAEMQGIPHHLIDFAPTDKPFSVAEYVTLAKGCTQEIYRKGKIPIMAGGTGLYIRSFLNNLQFSQQEKNEALCEELAQKAKEQGTQALVSELQRIDPQSAQRIDPNNTARLIRAIEIYRTTGITMTEQIQRSRQIPSPYSACVIGLDYQDRARLYARIDRRVDQMLEMGLVQEAKQVLAQPGNQTALQAIGYKELLPYFQGEMTLQEAVERIKRETRRYAKRQLTWFRKEPHVHWLKVDLAQSEAQLLCRAKEIISSFPF